jgi:type III restriction enzyme
MPVEWTETDLVHWLDKELRQDDVSQEKMEEWVRRAVHELLASKRFDLSTLVRAKYLLCRELLGAITKSRETAYRNAYQELLFGPSAALETSYNYSFEYDPKNYPANWFYTGGYNWRSHYYERPGELQNDGEEFDCAVALDAQPEVLYWVRNLERQKDASFWLQTYKDRFYPDFVAVLKDGRTLVVEYKGGRDSDSPSAISDRSLGEKYQDKSNGKALFLMAVQRDDQGRGAYDQIKAKIEGW